MDFVGAVAVIFAVVFAVLTAYWWLKYNVLEQTIQQALSSPRRGGDSCLGLLLVLSGGLGLLLAVLLLVVVSRL